MDKKIGVKFGEYHTYEEWGLRLINIKIGMPSPKKILVEIPGGNGVLDLSESLTGNIQYNTRQLEFIFDARNCDYFSWSNLMSDIGGKLHGKKEKIILDIDPSYYYYGIIEVSSDKSNDVSAQIVITAECQPYKMELQNSLEDWEWDPFNFANGIIRNYANLTVNGSYELNIQGGRKEIIPEFIAAIPNDGTLSVKYKNTTYLLKNGNNRILSIVLTEGDNILKFTGAGTVSVVYRGGIL